MSIIIFHPKNKEKELKKPNFDVHSAYIKNRERYRTFMFLFTLSAITNVLLLAILAHSYMIGK